MATSSTSPEDVSANMKALTKSIFDGFHTGTNESLLPNAASDFEYHLHPASLQMEKMTRADFVAFWETNVAPILEDFHASFHSETYDVEARRSVVHLSSTADTPLGKQTWQNEAMFICQFSDDGNTLLKIDEL